MLQAAPKADLQVLHRGFGSCQDMMLSWQASMHGHAHQLLPAWKPWMSGLQVVVVPLLAGATGKADVKPLTYVSALMALAGVGLLVEKGGVIMPNSGDLWSFASAVFFGVQVRLQRCTLLHFYMLVHP